MVTTAMITGLGYGEKEIRGLVAHGDLIRLHRGIYADGRTRLSPWTHLKAALLAAGPRSFLSHRSAAAARGYRNINVRDIHVSVVAASTPKLPGITVHRTSAPGRGEVTTASGLRASSAPRILVELSPTAKRAELDELITAAERRHAMDDMEEILSRYAGRPGMPNLREALRGHLSTPAGNSNYESAFWKWFWPQADLPNPDEINVRLGPYEFDGLWHQQRLILELDSRSYHDALADKHKDDAKDAYVQKLGWRILRVRDFRFEHDRAGIRTDLLDFLTVRQAA